MINNIQKVIFTKSTLFVLVVFGCFMQSCNFQRTTIKGSDTVLPLSQKVAENYMKKHSSINVSVTGGGSGVGIAALLTGSTDIAQSSRKIKFMERQKITGRGLLLKETIVAYDVLAIVVHPENSVSKLTREQLEDIFTGKIKNWREVGGADLNIVAYSRETSSGTYEFFKESVLANKNYLSGIMSLPATGAIIQSIGQTKGAIGYVGLAYLNKAVKSIAVSYDSGVSFTYPSEETAKNKTYPIVRPLYYYSTKEDMEITHFIDYVLSPEGQKLVKDVGYISAQ